jgi:hypothetical protein
MLQTANAGVCSIGRINSLNLPMGRVRSVAYLGALSLNWELGTGNWEPGTGAVNLVGCSTPGGDYRTPGNSYPDDQEHGKYCARSHCNALQKIDEGNAQVHSSIVASSERSSEITMALILIGECPRLPVLTPFPCHSSHGGSVCQYRSPCRPPHPPSWHGGNRFPHEL